MRYNQKMSYEGLEIHGYIGLTATEAKSALARAGENVIFHRHTDRPLVSFLKKFNSPLLILLAGASAVSMYLGEWASGGVIALMIVLSAVLDFVNTYRSERVAEKLASTIITTVEALRDGKRERVPIRLIVPGDIVYLAAGNVLPADGILVAGDDLFVNQSALTGESFPVGKTAFIGPPEGAFACPINPESPHALFMGTSVISGFGIMLVVQTGAEAEFGKIAARLAAENPETSYDRGIRSFSFFIMRLAFFMVGCMFLINAVKGDIGVLNALLFAIAIAVGLTPELLPVVMTVTLSRGSLRMAKRHVVVRHLPAIQNLGAMTVLATDKTGTLTEDRITLVRCTDLSGKEAREVFEAAYLASVYNTERKSPLDEAVTAHGKVDLSAFRKVDEIPFDFSRKRGSIVLDHGEERLLIAKGAPEELVRVCTTIRTPEGEHPVNDRLRARAIAQYEQLSHEGFRVLAIATVTLPREESIHTYTRDAERDLTLIGFAAFYDPPKTSAREAVRDLALLSVRMKIITGDSELLTLRVCHELGLSLSGVLTGAQVAGMSDEALTRAVGTTSIFARVTPEQKERVVTALKRAGETVGYLGDGINDAPALKAADIGISVNNAVDVAKETADIILLRKGLDVLAEGIREGRRTFENTMKYVRMGFSSNFGNMASMTAAAAFLPFLPMQPAQILVNNFLYDLSQTTLPTDYVDDSAIIRPRAWDIAAIKRYMVIFGLVSSVFDLVTFYVLYHLFGLTGGAFQTGWFIESIATQVLVVHVIRTGRLPFFESTASRPVLISTAGITLVAVALTYLPFSSLLGFVALPLHILAAIGGIVFTYLLIAEGAKRYYLYRERSSSHSPQNGVA